jgi:hypothetical protein
VTAPIVLIDHIRLRHLRATLLREGKLIESP